MSAIDDGGPAYPSHGTMGEVVCHGASLRDVFAMHAMQGMLANDDARLMDNGQIARIAYMQADDMLAARKAAP